MNIWKNLAATTLAVAAGAALCVAPASAQVMRHAAPSADTIHARAVMNAHKATMAARHGHPKRAKHYAAVAQRQYNKAFRKRMYHSRMR